ncbi:MAG TPA: hypothetical protein VEW93_00760 [Acidimicrobiales bacterium]|nr:hypothetical protein [Acidimicrobiales bacterium]
MKIDHLVRGAKDASGLPVRSLAAAAGVAGSTITRIQAGEVDPSIGTLARIVDAAGYELRIEAIRRGAAPRPSLADTADAWANRKGRLRLDWTRWRLLLDQLALHPKLVPEAIYRTPWPTGEPVVDALLAAVAEKLADDAGLPRPAWTEAVPSLDEPFRPPTARAAPGRGVPAQLAARGLMIDVESLWRDRGSIGV